VGSGPHHAAPYIRHSWRMNQDSSVNNILSEGPDLLGAEVVGRPTTSASSRTASTSSPTVHRRRRRLLIKFTYKPYGISLFLSKTEHRRKIYHQSPKVNPTSANPSRSLTPKIQHPPLAEGAATRFFRFCHEMMWKGWRGKHAAEMKPSKWMVEMKQTSRDALVQLTGQI
jgi:hypothetical protein